jgi:hypothetical protein
MSNRIAIVGPVASGRSTLAARMGVCLCLPVIELDDHYWRHSPIGIECMGRHPGHTKNERVSPVAEPKGDLPSRRERIGRTDVLLASQERVTLTTMVPDTLSCNV